ncbi:hexose transporter, partial [Trypanosoma conorhini]
MEVASDACPAAEKPQGNVHSPPEEAPAFCSAENLKVAAVQAVGGTMYGVAIGFVGVYAYLYLMSTDCSMYKSRTACDTVLNAECGWNATRGECGWKSFTCYWAYGKNEAPCLADDRCK